MTTSPADLLEQEMQDTIFKQHHDPLAFVKYVFDWNKGELAGHDGPRTWQAEFLQRLGDKLRTGELTGLDDVLREATSSGHGIGKSALVAWLILWAMSTFEDTRGVITANTESQLRTKTWAELTKWHRLAINSHWFTCTATALYSNQAGHEKTWRVDAIAWSETNTEAFAGLHNQGRRVLLIFDEASAISDAIWEVSEGALTDAQTEVFWFAFGNPTRNSGRFRRCFGDLAHRWHTQQIDSRTVEGTNRKQLDEWVQDYGEDSDFVRVRVRGLFPRASSLQFIPSDFVAAAQQREARANLTDPLIMALDIARGGDDDNRITFRRGLDARTIKSIKIPGSETRDSMRLVAIVVDLLNRFHPDAFFYDGTGVGGPVGDRVRQLGYTVIEVQFGAASPDSRYANMRAYIWAKLREWLQHGGAIEADPELEMQLTAPEYTHNKRDQLLLEPKENMKKRGLRSPDWADSLAMTFASPVAPREWRDGLTGEGGNLATGKSLTEWDPYADA